MHVRRWWPWPSPWRAARCSLTLESAPRWRPVAEAVLAAEGAAAGVVEAVAGAVAVEAVPVAVVVEAVAVVAGVDPAAEAAGVAVAEVVQAVEVAVAGVAREVVAPCRFGLARNGAPCLARHFIPRLALCQD